MNLIAHLKKILANKFSPWIRYVKWLTCGAPIPSPSRIKSAVIRRASLASKADVFIETGTYKGDTVQAVKGYYTKVISIEIDNDLFNSAVNRFKSSANVQICLGDSTNVLPTILGSLTRPALFWLDGHYSGGETGCGKKITPIEEEISLIRSHNIKTHSILIDDIRLFNGKDGYPKLGTLIGLIETGFPDHAISIEHDILVCLPTPL